MPALEKPPNGNCCGRRLANAQSKATVGSDRMYRFLEQKNPDVCLSSSVPIIRREIRFLVRVSDFVILFSIKCLMVFGVR